MLHGHDHFRAGAQLRNATELGEMLRRGTIPIRHARTGIRLGHGPEKKLMTLLEFLHIITLHLHFFPLAASLFLFVCGTQILRSLLVLQFIDVRLIDNVLWREQHEIG